MNPNQHTVLRECASGALSGDLTFPQIIERLSELGVERYHADYSRHEITYYFPDGDSAVVPTLHAAASTGSAFSASDVEAAIRQSQRNEHSYLDFIRKTMAAGCVGYFVQIAGQRAIYFGRNGESHVEPFPVPTTI